MPDVLLVIDPDNTLRDEVARAAGDADVRILRVASAEQAFAHLNWGWVDLLICSPDLPGAEGYDVVPQLRRRLPRIAIAFASEDTTADLCARAMARGVSEILPRPVEPGALRLLLHRSHEHLRSRRNNGLLHRELRRAIGERPIVAASAPMIGVLEQVERATASTSPTLLWGEPGSGKEAVARAIHLQSPWADAPFVALSCASASESYIESELFGRARAEHSDGAPARRGLLVEAHGGTLYLNEIGGLSRRMQTRLAQTLGSSELEIPGEDRHVDIDIHVLASTQRDLIREAKSGRFDDPLIGLFDPSPIVVPPLRDRREDIPLLADSMIAQLRMRHGRDIVGVSDAALDALTRYSWPGNVRELENALDRAVLLAEGDRIDLRDLPDAVQPGHTVANDDVWALRPARRSAEIAAIRRALRATGGNRTHAARLLKISQRALLYKLKDYEIRD